MTNPGTRDIYLEEMALSQAFPSEWEIRNDRLSGNGPTLVSDDYDYRDVRDDRVDTFFDLQKTKTFRIGLTATYAGRFYLPDLQCKAMYDESILARIPGTWINVTIPQDQ